MLNHRHKWISRLKKGDVLRSRSGMLRVIRKVSHRDKGYGIKTCVTFCIQRNSWTTRPYTVYFTQDLINMGYTPVRKNLPLRKKFDRTLEGCFSALNASECSLHSWDVLGVA